MTHKRLITKTLALIMTMITCVICFARPCITNANTDSEKNKTWEEVEAYCRSFLGGFKEPNCADYVSMIMRDCAYYPGDFYQHPRAKEMRRQLVNNNYQLVASNITYRMSVGIDKATAVKLAEWIAQRAKPGDILIWVRNTSGDVENTGCSHVSIYCGVKQNMKSYNGITTWPAHYSNNGAGGITVCQALWEYICKGPTSGRGYGIYIYRRPGDEVEPDFQGRWEYDDNGKVFYNHEDTMLISHWKEISGKVYYFDNTGHAVTGLRNIGGKLYYFDGKGAMFIGWKTVDGKTYLFGNDGAARRGWIKVKSDKYYIGDDYVTYKGVGTVDGNTYHFDNSGAMTTGWIIGYRRWSHYDKKGRLDMFINIVNNRLFLCNKDGSKRTGWLTIEGKKYYFDSDGEMSKGWKNIDDNWYYFGRNGIMTYSRTVAINGLDYQFDKDGKCLNFKN